MSHDIQDPTLDLAPRAGRLGAEVRGVRLSADLAPETFAAIHRALLRHKALFFRGQRHLDDAGQQALARLWGELVAHPTVPSKDGTRHVLELDSLHGARANSWHTDVTFDLAYPKVSVLRGVVIPPVGGDTVWANTVAAYERLPAELKALADRLRAVHTNTYDYAHARETPPDVDATRRYREVFAAHEVETEHPVVRVHPETGERSLVLAALYESWSIPLSVMLVVPLGLIGAVAAVLLRGLPNDVFFKVGMITVIGLSAKNAILIVEFAKQLRDQGKGLVEAAVEAARLRLRPILMTSLAFGLGVVPLMVASGASAETQHAIGTGVFGGMVTATVLAVFFVPVFYVVVMGLQERFDSWRASRHPALQQARQGQEG